MAAGNLFRLKLTLPTLKFCRSKKISSHSSESPLASSTTTLFSPINPKSLEISYPSFPDPPPTPAHPPKTMPVSFNIDHCPSPSEKIYNSPVAYDSEDNTTWPITSSLKGEKTLKVRKYETKKSKSSSISSGESRWFSSDEDENGSLISSSENFDSSCDFDNIPIISQHTKKKNGVKGSTTGVNIRRLESYVSSSWKSDGQESPERNSSSLVFRQLTTSCAVTDKSFAVVKNSKNPYEDFKSSMMEMIIEKQMIEAIDLEELLQCFLSLNSRHHHGAIVQAFSEIWHLLFL